jgi:DNA processing protein
MTTEISANTQAILLLTAPLITGARAGGADLLSPAEYRRLARELHTRRREPADLLGPDADAIILECAGHFGTDRVRALLARGFALSQALDRWYARSIWVVSRADAGYPARIKSRLRESAPPVFYGSGDRSLLETGGLAVVGSRHASEELLAFTAAVGSLAARAGWTTVSGGARGIDQAAMRSAAETGGRVVGVLADRLERAILNRDNRNFIRSGQLVLISPFDPSAGFNAGHAMQRNKLIYGLADAALVVSSDYQKGGTWAGAVEQLEKLRFVPVFVRSNGEHQRGIDALQRKGAMPWPDPVTPQELASTLSGAPTDEPAQEDPQIPLLVREQTLHEGARSEAFPEAVGAQAQVASAPEEFASYDDLPDATRRWFARMNTPRSLEEIANELQVSQRKASGWLKRLVAEGVLERSARPVRYRAAANDAPSLFD